MFFGVAHAFHLPKLSAVVFGLRSSHERRELPMAPSALQLPSVKPLDRGLIAEQREQSCLRLKDSLVRWFFYVASGSRRGLPSNQSFVPTPGRAPCFISASGGAAQLHR
jgi:hypothetical protein